jgi:hypothetical protein
VGNLILYLSSYLFLISKNQDKELQLSQHATEISVFCLDQGSPNYGPQAGSGPPHTLLSGLKNVINKFLKIDFKISFIP